jgi:hypothetical protein
MFLQSNKTLDPLKSARRPNENVMAAARIPGEVRETVTRRDTEDGEKLEMPAITLVDRVRMRVKKLKAFCKVDEAGHMQNKRQRPRRRVETLQRMADRGTEFALYRRRHPAWCVACVDCLSRIARVVRNKICNIEKYVKYAKYVKVNIRNTKIFAINIPLTEFRLDLGVPESSVVSLLWRIAIRNKAYGRLGETGSGRNIGTPRTESMKLLI